MAGEKTFKYMRDMASKYDMTKLYNTKKWENINQILQEVAHKMNGNSSPSSLKPLPTKDLSEPKPGSNNNDLEARPAQCV